MNVGDGLRLAVAREEFCLHYQPDHIAGKHPNYRFSKPLSGAASGARARAAR